MSKHLDKQLAAEAKAAAKADKLALTANRGVADTPAVAQVAEELNKLEKSADGTA
jgi:hypothetical protein